MLLYLNLIENGELHGDLFRSMHQCRHRNFVQRQDYLTYTHNSIAEFDRYDTPGTYYLVWLDENKEVRGTIRLNPMNRPTMISEIFPHMVEFEEIPQTSNCWEGTRICIDKELPIELRMQIKNELVIGTIELCIAKGCEWHYGMMQNAIFRQVYEKSNVKLTYLGQTVEVGRQSCRVAKHPTNLRLLNMLRILYNIKGPIVQNIELPELSVAA